MAPLDGPQEVCADPHMSVADQVKSLRKALRMTQSDVVDRSDGLLTQDLVSKIETGKNKATSSKVRRGLAKGFGVSQAKLEQYLEERLPLDSITLERMFGLDDSDADAEPRPPGAAPLNPSEWDEAVWQAINRDVHSQMDYENVRRALRGVDRLSLENVTQVEIARKWLDAAARLRRRGLAFSDKTLALELTGMGKADATQVAREDDRERELREKHTPKSK